MHTVFPLAPASPSVYGTGTRLMVSLVLLSGGLYLLPGIGAHPIRFLPAMLGGHYLYAWLRQPRVYVVTSTRLVIRFRVGSRSWRLGDLCEISEVEQGRISALRLYRPFPALFGYRGRGFDAEQGLMQIQALTLQGLLQLRFETGGLLWLGPANLKSFEQSLRAVLKARSATLSQTISQSPNTCEALLHS